MRLVFAMVLVAVNLGCGYDESGVSELKAGSGSSEVATAYNLLDPLPAMTRCDFVIERKQRKNGDEGLQVRWSFIDRRDDKQTHDYFFSNTQSNRSEVDVKYGFLTRVPYAVELMYVDVRSAPAYMYQLDFSLADKSVDQIRVRVFYGSRSTVLEDFYCS